MPISFIYIEGEDMKAPIFVCDHCGKRIAEASSGMTLGDVGLELRFVHKGDCDRAFHASHPEYGSEWDELAILPILLARSIGLDLRDLQRLDALARRSGITD